jgi:hypothetical protein
VKFGARDGEMIRVLGRSEKFHVGAGETFVAEDLPGVFVGFEGDVVAGYLEKWIFVGLLNQFAANGRPGLRECERRSSQEKAQSSTEHYLYFNKWGGRSAHPTSVIGGLTVISGYQ